jgi:ABC-type sugar transport system ATPase subunit
MESTARATITAEVMENTLLDARNITKRFPGVVALNDVSLSVVRGQIHSLCGENGAGKSTLIKILCGIYPHGTYEGTILFQGKEFAPANVRDAENLGISTIFQELTLFRKLTVAENLFVGNWPQRNGVVDWKTLQAEAAKVLTEVGLNIDPRIQVEDLGIGHQQLIEISKAIRKKSQLLILDEPTSALSENEIETLFTILLQMKQRGVTCIYISHKLEEILRISDTITVLRDGQCISTRNASELNHAELIYMMVGRELKDIFPRVEQKRDEPVLQIENWTLFKNSTHLRKLVDSVNLTVHRGEILGVAGLMGAGRTELAESLFGLHEGLCSGTMKVEGKRVSFQRPAEAIRAGLTYLPEDRKRHGLVLHMKVSENITLASLKLIFRLLINRKIEEDEAARSIERFRIKTPGQGTIVNNLSGGNQQKVVIGKWLLTKPKVLILDEVTRGVDVGAKYEIYKIINELVEKGVAVVMISSELPELIGICNRIVVMHEGRLRGEFIGDQVTQEQIMACAMSRE